jgi:hypothetical protein
MTSAKAKAIEITKQRGGIIRTREAIALGIHRRTFYGLRNEGRIITAQGDYLYGKFLNNTVELAPSMSCQP